MTSSEAVGFAEQWVESFNRRDVESVLYHFADECTFSSPKAMAITGRETLNSRQELRDYWSAAVGSIRSLHFTLQRVVNDPAAKTLVILYRAEIDGVQKRAAEVYEFDDSSRIIRGEALYGALVSDGIEGL
jgi:hypothetical protein